MKKAIAIALCCISGMAGAHTLGVSTNSQGQHLWITDTMVRNNGGYAFLAYAEGPHHTTDKGTWFYSPKTGYLFVQLFDGGFIRVNPCDLKLTQWGRQFDPMGVAIPPPRDWCR